MKCLKSGMAAGLLGLATVGFAGEQPVDMQAELKALKAEVAAMRSANHESWLSERRAEEVKSLIREVLADSDTRASLAEGGITAGHNGKAFYLTSEDGNFLLTVGGQMQFRYLHNFDSAGSGGGGDDNDDDDGGFQVRRAKLAFGGQVVAGPTWEYEMVVAFDREEGAAELEDFIIGTNLTDALDVKFGKFKVPFLREELLSSKRQLAVDRGLVTEFFTTDRSEQVQLGFSGESVRGWLSIHDGADEEFSTIGADPAEVGFAGRAELLLAGSFKNASDFNAWSNDPLLVTLGGAAVYQLGDGFNADNSSESDASYLGWTADALVKMSPVSIMGAVMGGHIDTDGGSGAPASDRDMYGAMVQAGVFVIPDKLEPFVRFEWLDPDNNDSDGLDGEAMFLTFGANYYFAKHSSKVTLDVVWALDIEDSISSNPFGNSIFSDGLGFSGDGVDEDTFIVRAQYQLVF